MARFFEVKVAKLLPHHALIEQQNCQEIALFQSVEINNSIITLVNNVEKNGCTHIVASVLATLAVLEAG